MPEPSRLEQDRLAAVHALQWLETAATENFDRICRLAASYFQVPTVLISLVEQERQWFLARVGFELGETPIHQSFCRYTIAGFEVMQVPDARLDPRFSSNNFVLSSECVRFYAGSPLRDNYGRALGSLCLIDKNPRQLTANEITALQDFAEMVMVQINQQHLLRYRNALTGLPNLQQLLIDTQGISLPSGQVRLVVVMQLGEHPGPVSEEIARRLRLRLQSVGALYQISDRDFCVQLSYDTAQHQELFRGLVTIIDDCISEHRPRIGLAICEDGTLTVESLLHKAVHAAGGAAARRSGWALYDEVQDFAHRRALGLINDFSAALANGDVYLEYQPRFSLESGRMLGAEALIGWHHPALGKLSPAEFIPLIERGGRISDVTRWVIQNALRDLARCVDQEVRLAVNLSPLDFHSMDIARTLHAACLRHGIAPTRLEVEITEGEWVLGEPQVVSQLHAVRNLGVDVAIDDFGTGYSNFAYLQEIPANVLKVDKSLITDLEHSPRNRIIAQSVFQLARQLDYRTVAEGIESFRCLHLVREYGCDEAQGFFMSRPLEVEHFLRHCGDSAQAFCPKDVSNRSSVDSKSNEAN